MIEYETKRLIGKSAMIITDGRLVSGENKNSNIDIINIEPQSGYESAFVYLLKETGEKVCHIGITWQRNRFEVSYGTEDSFRKNGYMCEALSSLLEWLSNNTSENEVWGLPNGPESEHILKKCGFTYNKEDKSDFKWFLYRLRLSEGFS